VFAVIMMLSRRRYSRLPIDRGLGFVASAGSSCVSRPRVRTCQSWPAPPSGNAGELRSGCGGQGPSAACPFLVLVLADDGGPAGHLLAGAGFAGRVLAPAAEGGFDPAGADAGPARPVQVRQDSAADAAG
jgi:hypothetical protein